MKNITLGLGIVLGHVFIKQVYVSIAHVFVGPVVNKAYHIAMLTSEISIPIGIGLAALLLQKHGIFQRLPEPTPGRFYLRIGVYTFLSIWLLVLASRLIPFAVYVLASFPPLAVMLRNQYLFYSVANLFIFYGLFLSILSAKPSSHANP